MERRTNRHDGQPSNFSNTIRRRRQNLNLTQAEVARSLGVSEVAVGFWESGRRAVDLDRVPHLATVLELDATTLSLQALSEAFPRLYCQISTVMARRS
jgi:transcriptional regulator with XRE-family HTH domain